MTSPAETSAAPSSAEPAAQPKPARRRSTRAPAPTAEQLVLKALEQALRSGGERLLVTSGKKPENQGLFPSATTATSKAAIKQCLDGGLLEVKRTDRVKVSGRTQEQRLVAITAAGIDFLVARLEPDIAGTLLQNCVQEATEQQHRLEEQLQTTLQAQRQTTANLQALLGAFVERVTAAAGRIEDELAGVREQTGHLQSRLNGLLGDEPPPPHERPRPTTPEEYDFKRLEARQLVDAWEGILGSGAEHHLESALFNLGLRPIGERGQRLPFDGAYHQCPEPVFQDDPVEIVQPGWMLPDDKGEYLVAKARVQSLAEPSEDVP